MKIRLGLVCQKSTFYCWRTNGLNDLWRWYIYITTYIYKQLLFPWIYSTTNTMNKWIKGQWLNIVTWNMVHHFDTFYNSSETINNLADKIWIIRTFSWNLTFGFFIFWAEFGILNGAEKLEVRLVNSGSNVQYQINLIVFNHMPISKKYQIDEK